MFTPRLSVLFLHQNKKYRIYSQKRWITKECEYVLTCH